MLDHDQIKSSARGDPKISVIICTFNRCESLMKALKSVANSKLPGSVSWEVLIVDNNSTDNTASLVKNFCQSNPDHFRYDFEGKQGKSHALNHAIRQARGEVFAFMDDDVTVEPDWLWNLTACLFEKRYLGSGGRILPERSFSPPRWLPLNERYALAPLAVFDLGPDARDLDEPPFGTNMAFHRRTFDIYGGFRSDLGPRPGSEIRNEDTELGRRLLAAGERLRYEGSAVVYHAVPEHRLRRGYFLAWSFDKARADVREQGSTNGKWAVSGVPLPLLRKIAIWTVRWIFAVQPSHRFSCKLNVWALAGSILENHRVVHGVETS